MVRAATLEDLADLVEINVQVHRLHLAARPNRYRDATREEIGATLRDLLAQPDVTILAAESGGGVCGYAQIRRVDSPGTTLALPRVSVHVDALGVREDARRGGHGRALMQAVEAQARAWGAAGVSLDVQWFNQDAVRFYEAIGYSVTTCRMGRPLG